MLSTRLQTVRPALFRFAPRSLSALTRRRSSYSVLIYPAKKAPNYPIGYKAAAAFAVASIAATGLFYHLDRKTRAAREARDKIEFDCTCPPESRR